MENNEASLNEINQEYLEQTIKHNTFSLKDKIEALGLLEVDTDPTLIAELYQLYQHDSKKEFKYFKRHGDTVMYYSEEYLEQTSIEKLLLKDVCNQIY